VKTDSLRPRLSGPGSWIEDGDPIQNMQGGGRPATGLPAAAAKLVEGGYGHHPTIWVEYRIFNLPPGKYFMKASRQTGCRVRMRPDDVEEMSTYAPVFLSGAWAEAEIAGAQVGNWGPGQQMSGDEPDAASGPTTPPFVAPRGWRPAGNRHSGGPLLIAMDRRQSK